MVELTPKHRIDNERIDKLTKRVRRTEILFLFMAMFFVTKIFTDHHNHASINASSLHELENAISSLRDNQHDMAIKIEQDVSHYVKRKLGEMKRDSISKDMIHDSHAQKRKILRMETKEKDNKATSPVEGSDRTLFDGTNEKYIEEPTSRRLQNEDPSATCMGSLFYLDLQLDDRADEIYWELVNQQTNTIVASQTYKASDNWKHVNYSKCVESGRYVFSLYDAVGNGLNCGSDHGCFNISIGNVAFIEGSAFTWESVHGFFITNEGDARVRKCHQLPILSPANHLNNFVYDDRIADILNIIHGLSSLELLSDVYSHQYKAACWLIHDDTLKISSISQYLIERYAVAVSLYATNQDAEVLLDGTSVCHYDESKVKCNDEGRVISIEWRKFDVCLMSTILIACATE